MCSRLCPMPRYPRRKRALVPVRWYHGTFALDCRTLRIPTARGCPPLVVRLDREVPYPVGQVRSVTLGWAEGRLHVDVTAEVPVTTYPQGQEPDPARVARSEEHTSELQSHVNLVCRLLL